MPVIYNGKLARELHEKREKDLEGLISNIKKHPGRYGLARYIRQDFSTTFYGTPEVGLLLGKKQYAKPAKSGDSLDSLRTLTMYPGYLSTCEMSLADEELDRMVNQLAEAGIEINLVALGRGCSSNPHDHYYKFTRKRK